MDREWSTIVSREVGEDRKLRLPGELVDLFDEDGMDLSVFWNYEKNTQYLVLSTRPLNRENYQPVTRTKVYDEGGYKKIRPPSVLSDVILSNFQRGTELFYLAYEAMTDGDGTQSVFLLTRSQVLQLLPDEAVESDQELETQILKTPGFIPSPHQ